MPRDQHLPYHLASSSLDEETEAAFGFGGGAAAFFLEKRATVLKVDGFDGVGAVDLAPPLKFRGFPSISETPREAAAVEAANEAMLELARLLVAWFTTNLDGQWWVIIKP